MTKGSPLQLDPKFGSLTEALVLLIERASTDLPIDVEQALQAAAAREAPKSQAAMLLSMLCKNIALARRQQTPMCQDTGTLTFFWKVPRGTDVHPLQQNTAAAVVTATWEGLLRQNTIETVSGRSRADNLALGHPQQYFEFWDDPTRRDIEVWLLLKGGGCENMGRQYSLPDSVLQAGRDLEGVRRVLLDAVWQAQGFGCAPGILGVCVGGDRAACYQMAKRQLLRPLSVPAADPALAELEERVLTEANSLGIGPMGMGGATTLLGVKIGALARLPASYFVGISYLCWAARRHGIRIDSDGTGEWLS